MDKEWLTANEALSRVSAVMSRLSAIEAICTRAFDELIRTKAKRLVIDNQSYDDCDIPPQFWWAKGKAALEQNWESGDFRTCIDEKKHARAYAVMFRKKDVEAIAPLGSNAKTKIAKSPRGRPPAGYWDDLLIEMFWQMNIGELKPESMADVERAMTKWLAEQGIEIPAKSTLQQRSRKLWKLWKKMTEN